MIGFCFLQIVIPFLAKGCWVGVLLSLGTSVTVAIIAPIVKYCSSQEPQQLGAAALQGDKRSELGRIQRLGWSSEAATGPSSNQRSVPGIGWVIIITIQIRWFVDMLHKHIADIGCCVQTQLLLLPLLYQYFQPFFSSLMEMGVCLKSLSCKMLDFCKAIQDINVRQGFKIMVFE